MDLKAKNTTQLLNKTLVNITLNKLFELKHKIEDQDVIQFKQAWNFVQSLVKKFLNFLWQF